MLIGYLFGIKSIRRLIEDLRIISLTDGCDLSLNDSVPHHASLSRILKRYGEELHEKFFYAIVNQCQKCGLLSSKSIMTDTILIQANASLNSLREVSENVSKNKQNNIN